jgi:hypothetical protein
MRYVITKDQFHHVVYNILDELLEDGKVEREKNPHVKSGKTYRLNMYDKNGENFITYFYFEPGEDDDGNVHDGHGSIHLHWKVNDTIKKLLSIRQTKVSDIVGDWVSDKFNVDVDEIDIYPTK